MNEDYSNTSGYSRLFLTVHNGEINLLPPLLKEYSATEKINGRTLINVATARGHAEIVRMLMTKDTDVNTLLNIAIKENQPSVFHLLINECDVNAIDCYYKAPLHYATTHNRVEFVKILIEYGANVNIKHIYGRKPIFEALVKQNVQLADILFQNGTILTLDDKRQEHLVNAAISGNLEMIKLLTKNGWNNINTPLKISVGDDRLDVVEYLMNSVSKSSRIITQDGLNLYSICIQHSRLNILKYLIDSGIKSRRNMFNNSIFQGCNKVYKYLLTCRSKILADFTETQLHSAVRAGELETVKTIVDQQTNIVETDSLDCKLAVYIAVENGNEDVLKVLLDAGYSVKSCFTDISPLHLAATHEHTRLLELLLKAGVDVNSKTENRLTPLHFAALSARSNLVKFLLKNGANPSNGKPESSLSFALKSFSCSLHYLCVTSSVFTNLVEITKMLILKSRIKDFHKLLANAARITVCNDENEQNTEFRADLVTCIFNHLTDDGIEYYSAFLFTERNRLQKSVEFLHLLIEYNDSKLCNWLTLFFWGDYLFLENYMVQLLLIDYSTNINDFLNFGYNRVVYNRPEHHTVKINTLLKLVITRLVLLTDIGDSRVLKFCGIEDFLDLHKECETQKKGMQNTQVADDFKVTFYDILTQPVNKVANYMRNENFRKALESSYGKFPAFSDFLKIRIERGIKRKNLREECTNAMCNLIKRNCKIELSDADLHQIFQYFSVVDLRKFAAAFS